MRVRRRAAGRLGARGLGMLALCALLAGSAFAVPEGWFDAVELDAVDAALVERPGAALRHANDSVKAGETARAERLLSAIAARHPLVADVADLERLRLYVLTGRTDEAIALAGAWPHPKSPLEPDLYAEVGRAYAERGDEEAARAAWSRSLEEAEEGAARAALLLELARSQRRSGDSEAAAERLVEIWKEHPTSAEAKEAAAGLDRLEGEGAPALRSAKHYRERGDALFRARHNEEALEAYDRALEMGLSSKEERRARSQRAHTLFRLRRYSDATEAYAALPQTGEFRIARARSVARAGDPKAAAAELERIAKQVRGQEGARARLLAALLWSDEGEKAKSERLFESLASGRSSYAAAALWRLGWQAYRQDRFDEAIARFEQLGERETDPIGHLRPRYWRARALEKTGRPEEAAAEFGAMAREFPLSYYGWRASGRAAHGAIEAPAPRLRAGPSALRPRELERARILLEAGMEELARRDLDRLYLRADGLDDRLVLAQLYSESGDFHRPQRLVVASYKVTLARGPGHAPVELWWYAWPLPYQDAVRDATDEREGLHKELVYAVMREESGYRPEVVSVSGARGLLQLMPETAERVATREELTSFDVDDLFVPDVNIQLGAAYLDELLLRFSGRASAAIGSYNAGPHRVVRWLEETGGDDDEWVEDIPYEQTRAYVKRVLRSLHAYRVLY